MSDLIEDSWILISTFAFSLLDVTMAFDVQKKNLATHGHIAGKNKSRVH